jgi:hypothetical protein
MRARLPDLVLGVRRGEPDAQGLPAPCRHGAPHGCYSGPPGRSSWSGAGSSGRPAAAAHRRQACHTQRRNAAGCTLSARATSPSGWPTPTSPTAWTRTVVGYDLDPSLRSSGSGLPGMPDRPGPSGGVLIPAFVVVLAAGAAGGWAASHRSASRIASVCCCSRRRPSSPSTSCTSKVNPGGPGRARRAWPPWPRLVGRPAAGSRGCRSGSGRGLELGLGVGMCGSVLASLASPAQPVPCDRRVPARPGSGEAEGLAGVSHLVRIVSRSR